MKRLLFSTFMMMCAIFFVSQNNASAQSYRTAGGLLIDFGSGTAAGPAVKHFFNSHNAGQAMVLFGNNTTILGAEYSYNAPVTGAKGLVWNAGIGPQAWLSEGGGSAFAIRPMLGLEFTVPGAPINFGFDWRPAIAFSDGENDFAGGRFGLGIRFVFNR